MKVKELMCKKIVTASKFDTISYVSELMSDYDIGFVVIVNENREPLGVVTDRDIVIRGISRGKSPSRPIEEVMTHACIDINREEDCLKALEIMGEYQIRRLVITNENKRIVGIISLADLARGKYTNKLVNETLYEISIPNPQKDKPLKFLEVDDYPL
jgi:signal-transduction protein with cAMP-binding, CBS, and nucleotidyltransferase domain